jgi:fluoroacetyl-CoA thioesterase
MNVAPGTSAQVETTVGAHQTADAMGNPGVQVFATPFMIGLLENASSAVLRAHLPPGGGTVGTMVEIRHLAATPVGMKVTARATLIETDGRRFLFAVEAWNEGEKIAEGRHERYLVPDLKKFLDRAMRKGRS